MLTLCGFGVAREIDVEERHAAGTRDQEGVGIRHLASYSEQESVPIHVVGVSRLSSTFVANMQRRVGATRHVHDKVQ